MFYATNDTDGEGLINQDAHISKFATRAEAEAFLSASFDHDELREEGLRVEVTDGWFSDCWSKSQAAPKVGQDWISPFSRSQLYVQRPGQHPGGRQFWTTPRAEILVAVIAQK